MFRIIDAYAKSLCLESKLQIGWSELMVRQVFLAILILAAQLPNAQAQIKVIYKVEPIAQPSKMSCWATAATMLVNWKSGINRTISDVVKLAGPKFVAIYNASFANPPQGISPTDEADFYKALALKVIQGLNPTIGAWGNVLKQHGPLSITVDADPGKGYIHALVVIGFDGDGTAKNTIVSYIDPDGGKKRDVKFEDFLKLYEGSASWPLQIIHNP